MVYWWVVQPGSGSQDGPCHLKFIEVTPVASKKQRGQRHNNAALQQIALLHGNVKGLWFSRVDLKGWRKHKAE